MTRKEAIEKIKMILAECTEDEDAESMTNGEKFKEIFGVSQVLGWIKNQNYNYNVYVWLPNHDAIEIPLEWWNAPYMTESEG